MTEGSHMHTQAIRVLMDAQAFDIQTHGGISRCFAELIRHMPKSIDMHVPIVETKNVYLKQMGMASDKDYYIEFCKGHPTSLKRFWYKLSTNIKHGHWGQWDRMPRLNLFETEQQLANGAFDVFHPTYYNPYFLKKIGNKPFVLTVHDMISELYSGVYKFRDGQLKGKRKLIPRASHIIAVSEHTKQDIINLFGIAPEKISVIYHGIDQKPYVPSLNKNVTGYYILYVGDRNKYKNFQRFVCEICPVLENHPNLSVICTGKPFSSEEYKMFKDRRVQNRIIHRFVESNQELSDLYHYAQAFVYPSEYEGFGIPILEAYKAGCPVVLNRASCFPEIAGDAAVYFGFDGKGQSLQECIEDLLIWTPARKEHLIDIQRQRLKRYSWDKAAQELAEVYKKVVQEISQKI